MKLSFVIPCYRSEKTLAAVVKEIQSTVAQRPEFSYEIILVNDCSPDNVQQVIEQLCRENPETVFGIELARNFGQHAAILSGYHYITGDYVYSIDDDGQAPIEAIFPILDKLNEGYDIVWGSYENIRQNAFRRIGSCINGFMAEKMIGKPRNIQITSFRVARRFVIDEVIRYDNAYPYLLGLLLRTTSHIANFPVKHRSRKAGRSGYTVGKLFQLWLNGFTMFSVKPLRFASMMGFVFSGAGFAFMAVIILRKLLHPSMAVGYASIMSIILFIGGLIMLLLGMMGEYIGRIYICQNKAPQSVVRTKIGFDNSEDKK